MPNDVTTRSDRPAGTSAKDTDVTADPRLVVDESQSALPPKACLTKRLIGVPRPLAHRLRTSTARPIFDLSPTRPSASIPTPKAHLTTGPKAKEQEAVTALMVQYQ